MIDIERHDTLFVSNALLTRQSLKKLDIAAHEDRLLEEFLPAISSSNLLAVKVDGLMKDIPLDGKDSVLGAGIALADRAAALDPSDADAAYNAASYLRLVRDAHKITHREHHEAERHQTLSTFIDYATKSFLVIRDVYVPQIEAQITSLQLAQVGGVDSDIIAHLVTEARVYRILANHTLLNLKTAEEASRNGNTIRLSADGGEYL
jgi:hypothetical protein